MKAKDIIEALKKYNPEEEIMIAYWTKDLVQGWFKEENGEIITNDIWNEAVDEFDTYDLQDTADMILDCISEKINENK